MSFSALENQYYARQIMLEDIGEQGQIKLKQAKVLCIGAGGLGAPLLQYLAAAGIGTLGIMDADVVEISNLSRQIIYQFSDIGLKKVDAARTFLEKLNPFIHIETWPFACQESNASSILEKYDVIADCTDNLWNKYRTSQCCHTLDKPLSLAGIWKNQGQCMLFQGQKSPCLHCLFPLDTSSQNLPDCNATGVISVLPGIMGILQANMIIRQIIGQTSDIAEKLFQFDAVKMQLQAYAIKKDPDCALCVLQKNIPIEISGISVEELQQKIATTTPFILLDVRSVEEHRDFNIGGLHIPLSELTLRVQELDRRLPIIVYCQSENRSQFAADLLVQRGFELVCFLEGGINAWQRQKIHL